MKYDIDIFDIKTHCSMMNCDCVCITTAEMCPLFDNETGMCYFHADPSDWKIDKIKEGFEKLSAFYYGFKRFDYI